MRLCDRPLAVAPFTSYRYRRPYGWIMIGARSIQEALTEANRSLTDEHASVDHLQVWNGLAYTPITSE